MDAADLLTLLDGGPLVCDGGMGTALIDAGAPVGACFEAFNLDDPGRVVDVHRGFVEAGSRLLIANTFGGNRFRLRVHGEGPRQAALNHVGVELARAAGAELVAGSLGPLGVRLAPYGRVNADEAFDAYREQAAALAGAGADLFVIETQSDLLELEQAVLAVRAAAPRLPVLASATFTRDDRTLLGSTPSEVAARLRELGVEGFGVNCGEGPAQALRIVRAMAPFAAGRVLMARPNGGGPAEMGGRFVYPATPGYVGEIAEALLEAGVGIIGGCCGTGPAHTEAVVAAVRTRLGATRPRPAPEPVVVGDAASPPAPAAAPPTGLQSALERGDFVVTVEMEPPRSFSAARLVAAAATLRDAGADVIDVADSPMAKMRMSAWAACRLIQEQAGIETVLHFPTRGRNLLRLQGDLLGSYALGIRNLFVCVGDPVAIGDFPQALNDVDVTATGVLALVTGDLNRGRDRAGSSIGEPTAFFPGAAVAPNAVDLQREAGLLKRKVDAGAAFALSQPLYGPEPLRRLYEAYEEVAGTQLTIPVLSGLLPLVTARHAEFLHNEVPGIVIPDATRDRMRAAGADAWREGLAMASELAGSLREAGAAGLYVMPQFGRYDLAAEVVEAARAASRSSSATRRTDS